MGVDGVPTLFDLSTISGRWRLTRDPAYKEWPKSEWSDAYQILGRSLARGWIRPQVYAYSKRELAFMTEHMGQMKRIDEMLGHETRYLSPCVVLFPARKSLLDIVCKAIGAKKKRSVTEAMRAQGRELGKLASMKRTQKRTLEGSQWGTTGRVRKA